MFGGDRTLCRAPTDAFHRWPYLGITSGAVIALAMEFNDLCTNTAKVGALLSGGRIEMRDSRTEAAPHMDEKRPVPRRRATRRSFGTMMEFAGQQLNGKFSLVSDGGLFIAGCALSSLTAKADTIERTAKPCKANKLPTRHNGGLPATM